MTGPAKAWRHLFGGVSVGKYTAGQLLAVGQLDVNDASNGLAILDRDHPDGDRIAGLEGTLEPAHVGHGGGIFGLRHPMRHLAALIGGVEKNHTMRIGPYELRDGSLEVNLLGRIVSRIAVVRGQRKRKDRQTDNQSEGDQEFAIQEPPPGCEGQREFRLDIATLVQLRAILKTGLTAVKRACAALKMGGPGGPP